MSPSPRHSRRVAVWTAVTAIAGLAAAGSAMAVEPPTGVGVTPASPTDAASVTVSFTPSSDDAGDVTYTALLSGTPAGTLPSGGGTISPDAGNYNLRVRAERGAEEALSDPIPLVVDRAAPSISVSLSGAAANGWFRTLQIAATCSDDTDLGGACPSPIPWNTTAAGDQGPVTMSVTDVLGRTTSAQSPTFRFDNTDPSRPGLIGPGPVVGQQPTFSWSKSTDTGSGVDRYQVQWQREDDFDTDEWQTLASVVEEGDYTAPPSAWNRGPLPEFVPLVWRVVAVDEAGNERASLPGGGKTLMIDPTVPPAPLITGGPTGPTQNTSPTFSWEGNGASYEWSVTPTGSSNPIRGGAGPATQADIPSLPDGAYVFRVKQFVVANPSEEAIRSFVVDTTPPAPPTIIGRPTFPSLGDAIFSWSTEPGAYSRWSVTGRSGNAVVQPTDTPVTSAKLPSLAEDAYTFSVKQVDAAGNESQATVEPFTVIAPLVVPAPSNGIVTLLPKQNARRLQPKAGKTVFSRTPVLRWSRGPKGTKLFNLQIFRVTVARNSRTPKVTKILSVFPKSRAYRVPKGKTRPKTCYVWRVWPYTGREFTPKPLGVSNYCVASQKVLARKAAVIATRKAAKVAARSRR
jgi:hypothetical protein